MEWPGIVALLVILTPLFMIVLTVLVLVPLAHLAPPAPTLARTSLTCPALSRRALVAFVTVPGFATAVDVDACSIHGDAPVRCGKACLSHATVTGTSSPMNPRFALVADGVAYRDGDDAGGALG